MMTGSVPAAAAAAILASKTLSAEIPQSSGPTTTKRPHLIRRRVRSPAVRGGGGGWRSGPATPLLRWKFDDSTKPPSSKPAKQRRNANVSGGDVAPVAPPPPAVSVRRLAAAIWQLQLPEFGAGRGNSEHVPEHLQAPAACNLNGMGLHMKKKKNELSNSFAIHHLENGVSRKLGASNILPNCALEKATKWDPGSKVFDEVYHFSGNLKSFEEQEGSTASFIYALQTELKEARAKITELEAEKRTARKNIDHFMSKLAEDKASWRNREHEKVRAIIDGIKSDLNRERKNRQRMEIVNSKLVNELAKAKLSAKRFMQDFEKERKARQVMEEVCDELAKEIGEDKAEVEALKRESMKIREEIEEERRMLQMAEVWREERVQIKLIDAKLTLDEKYSQLSKLRVDMEAFLVSRNTTNSNPEEIKEAESLRDAIGSVKIQDIKEFTYQPPLASEDIYSIFEELKAGEEPNERDIEQCCGFTPTNDASNIHSVSPDTDDFVEKPKSGYTNGSIHANEDIEEDSGWETVSHVEEHGSSNSPGGSNPSVTGKCRDGNASLSGTDWEDNDGDNARPYSETSEVCSVGTKQSRKKVSSISRLWKSSNPSNGENFKKTSVEVANGRVSNGRISNATLSPDGGSFDLGLSPGSLGQWSSPDSVNPHITRGMKGCIEWPRGAQKHSLKAKLVEARLESRKIQLRHVLEQKI